MTNCIFSLPTARLTFLSSTVNGYEGTGRALSLKLIEELKRSALQENEGERIKNAMEVKGVGQVRLYTTMHKDQVHNIHV